MTTAARWPSARRGDVVVTQFDARAAPIIRYRVGDRATYRGWDQGRLLLSGIERAAEAAIGSTLVPYSDLRTWAPRLAARDPSVVAVQLVRTYSPGDQREQPVVRVIGAGRPARSWPPRRAACSTTSRRSPARSPAASWRRPWSSSAAPPATLAGHWKIPLYVDERTSRAQCPSD